MTTLVYIEGRDGRPTSDSLALVSRAAELGGPVCAVASGACAIQFFSGRSLSRHLPPAAFASLVHLAVWPGALAAALVCVASLAHRTSGAADS